MGDMSILDDVRHSVEINNVRSDAVAGGRGPALDGGRGAVDGVAAAASTASRRPSTVDARPYICAFRTGHAGLAS